MPTASACAGAAESDSRAAAVARTPLDVWIARKIGQASGPLEPRALAAWQTERLRQTVSRAKQCSAFYREALHDVRSDAFQSPRDVALLPLTTAARLRSSGSRMLCVGAHEVERIVTLATSGTEGDPKRVFFTAEDLELTVDFFRHGMATFTGAGDRVLVLMPGARSGSVGDLLQSGLAREDASAAVHGPVSDIDEALAVLERTQPSVVVGIPTQVLALARRGAARGRPIRSVHSVLLSADHVPRAVVRAVEALWRCRVFNHYGSTEMGFGGGVECAARDGYHLRAADLLFEIVSPETELPVADGEAGEIVFTTLTRAGMPLLRYRTGDMSRFLPGRCACGSLLPRLAPVGTRPAAAVFLRGGGRLQLADLDEAVLGRPDVIDFAPLLSGDGRRDELHILARPVGEGARVDTAALERAVLRVPAVAAAAAGGVLGVRVAVAADGEGWPASTGMLKRTFEDTRPAEEAHA